MSHIVDESASQAFLSYAAAFEAGFAADDWKLVAASLTDDVVWTVGGVPPPVGGVYQGRADVLRAMKQSCDSFDRRFDVREPRIVDGPTPLPGGGVYFTFVVTYRRAGVPPMDLHGEEWDFFRDGKLEFHREKLWNIPELLALVAEHDAALLPAR